MSNKASANGVTGVKNISLKMNNEGKVGEATFRAVKIRTSTFKGFGKGFDENEYDASSIVSFKISIG